MSLSFPPRVPFFFDSKLTPLSSSLQKKSFSPNPRVQSSSRRQSNQRSTSSTEDVVDLDRRRPVHQVVEESLVRTQVTRCEPDLEHLQNQAPSTIPLLPTPSPTPVQQPRSPTSPLTTAAMESSVQQLINSRQPTTFNEDDQRKNENLVGEQNVLRWLLGR